MKQFMVLCAVLPLMLAMSLQFCFEQINNYRISAVNACIYACKEQARSEGGFSAESRAAIRSRLRELGFSDEDILVFDFDDDAVLRLGAIHYSLSLRVDNAMAGAALFGISSEENYYCYSIDSYTTSELLEEETQ